MLPLWRYNWDSHFPMSALSQQDIALMEIQLRQSLSHVSFVTTRCCQCEIQLRQSLSHVSFVTTRCCPSGDTTETVTFPCLLCHNTMLPLLRYNWDSHFPVSPLSQHDVALWRYNWDSHFPMSPLSQQDDALAEIELRQSLSHVSFVTTRCCPCGDTTETITFPCLLCHNTILPLLSAENREKFVPTGRLF